MKLYIPKEHKKRTEYRILGDWYQLIAVDWTQLVQSTTPEVNSLVLVGRLLKKLGEEELDILSDWTFQEGNQLLCLPSWRSVAIDELLNLKVNLRLKKNQNLIWEEHDFFDLKYEIETTLQQGLITKTKTGNILTVNYKKHQYSGLLTVTTLPLLDLSLITKEEILKNEFSNLLIDETEVIKNSKNKKKVVKKELSEAALYILILVAADIGIKENLAEKLESYLYQQYPSQELNVGLKLLREQGFLDNEKISAEGKKYIKYKGYLPYVKEIKKKKSDQKW
ncbi:hypothetical protein MWH25_10995 [Natroniella acetigena]|uniref:hypothetical protein n=1 Tax=Natroniella acetigena TaxID=52004 RepID=UPI00200AE66A|nr:hypothetical protein [Natroniella acetigena]MCK8828259.1 hypothetical protein [Natroniella acetigena]